MTRGRLGILFAVAAIATLAAATWWWSRQPQRLEYFSDGATIRQPRGSIEPRDILWEPPRALSELLNTDDDDYEPRLSWDGLTLYFVRGKAGGNANLFVCQRTPAGWSEPQPLAALNSEYDELGPEPAPDGRSLFFYSDRPGGAGGYDLWMSDRTADGWSPPRNLGSGANSEFNDYGPAIAPDGARLYFASNRPQEVDLRQPDPHAWPATVREDLFRRTYDLYVAAITPQGVQTAQPLVALNTENNEGAPCLSPAGDFLHFSSDRPGGAGGFDLYRARRLMPASGSLCDEQRAWSAAENLGPPVNTSANELDPGLGALGFALFFSSDRTRESGVAATLPDYNLYYSTAREVFVDTELTARPPIDWLALWRAIGPNLLWLILALLLLALLWALWGDIRNRRLALLTRCLLASLMAHLLLMLLFNFWKVTAGVVEFVRRGGNIQVSLDGAVLASAIDAQIRSFAAAVDLPAAQAAPSLLAPKASPPPPVRALESLSAPKLETAMMSVNTPLETAESVPPVSSDPPRMAAAPRDDRPIELSTPRVDAPRMSAVEPPAALPPAAASPAVSPRPDSPVSPVPADSPFDVPFAPRAATTDRESAAAASSLARVVIRESPASQPSAAIAVTSLLDRSPAARPLELRLPAAPSERISEADQPTKAVATPAAVAQAALRPAEVPAGGGPTDPQAIELLTPVVTASSEHRPDNVLSLVRGQGDLREAAPPVEQRFDAGPAAAMTAVAAPASLDLRLPEVPKLEESSQAASAIRGAEDGLPTVGTIVGRVVDSVTQMPISAAHIQLDLPDGEPLTVATDQAGRYRIDVPEMPAFFALSASHDHYAPAAASVPSERLRRGRLRQDFRLDPRSGGVISIESTPRVHHLGNDLWEGSINSQFQTTAEGRQFEATFALPDEPGAVLTEAAGELAVMSFLAKGVQCSHQVRINGRLIAARMDPGPNDGSYGVYALPFDPSWLRAGENTLRIRAVSCMGDLDDFEFINVQIHLPQRPQADGER